LSVIAKGEGEEEAAAACCQSVCYHGFLSVKLVCKKFRPQQELDEQVEMCGCAGFLTPENQDSSLVFPIVACSDKLKKKDRKKENFVLFGRWVTSK
jgi:hypothetical protein